MSNIELLTSAEVAQRLGVDVRTVARWANSGRLPTAIKAPGLRGVRMFRPEDVEALTASQGGAA